MWRRAAGGRAEACGPLGSDTARQRKGRLRDADGRRIGAPRNDAGYLIQHVVQRGELQILHEG